MESDKGWLQPFIKSTLDRHPEMLLKENPAFERNRVRKAFWSWIYCIKKFKAHKLSCSQSWQMSAFSKRRFPSAYCHATLVVLFPLASLVFDISLPSQSSKCSESLVLQRQTLLSFRVSLNGPSADLDSLECVSDTDIDEVFLYWKIVGWPSQLTS